MGGSGYRGLCLGLGFYFVFATVVQLNDPDSYRWEAVYAATAALTFYSAWRVAPAWIPIGLAAVATVWALLLMPTAFSTSFRELFQSWQMMSPGMEVGREFLGLVIVAVWTAWLAAR